MIQVQLKLILRPAQERQLNRWLWRLTGVWNWAIKKIEADSRAGTYYGVYDIKALVKGHSVKSALPQSAIDGIAGDAVTAWRRCWSKLARAPRLKGRRNRLNSIPFTHGRQLPICGERVKVPKLGRVRFHAMRIPEGHVGVARIVRRPSGWYLCLFIQAERESIPAVSDEAVGIDPGFSSLLTLSTGEIVEHPHEFSAGAQRLAQAQRGGRRRLTARLYERQSNRRKDRNHKLSHRIVSENRFIAWSKDRTAAIARSFGKSVASASHHQLRQMLADKSRSGGREYIEVDSRNSTRICSACGVRNGPTGYAGLSVRRWVCACGADHDRDVNAAVNTLLAGLGMSLERGREAASGIVQ